MVYVLYMKNGWIHCHLQVSEGLLWSLKLTSFLVFWNVAHHLTHRQTATRPRDKFYFTLLFLLFFFTLTGTLFYKIRLETTNWGHKLIRKELDGWQWFEKNVIFRPGFKFQVWSHFSASKAAFHQPCLSSVGLTLFIFCSVYINS